MKQFQEPFHSGHPAQSDSDASTRLFLGQVASPQSLPPLHRAKRICHERTAFTRTFRNSRPHRYMAASGLPGE